MFTINPSWSRRRKDATLALMTLAIVAMMSTATNTSTDSAGISMCAESAAPTADRLEQRPQTVSSGTSPLMNHLQLPCALRQPINCRINTGR